MVFDISRIMVFIKLKIKIDKKSTNFFDANVMGEIFEAVVR